MDPESTYTRNSNLLPAYQKIVEGQMNDHFVKLSQKECQDLVGLIATLEEENRRLCRQANQVSQDLQSLYGSED